MERQLPPVIQRLLPERFRPKPQKPTFTVEEQIHRFGILNGSVEPQNDEERQIAADRDRSLLKIQRRIRNRSRSGVNPNNSNQRYPGHPGGCW
jgi:hypothetical protein